MSKPSTSSDMFAAELAKKLMQLGHVIETRIGQEIESRGFPGCSRAHVLILDQLAKGVEGSSTIGRQIGVSKQAVDLAFTKMENRGLIAFAQRSPRADAQVTPKGAQLLQAGMAAIAAASAKLAAEAEAEWPQELLARLNRFSSQAGMR